jgi:hypothetical protein
VRDFNVVDLSDLRSSPQIEPTQSRAISRIGGHVTSDATAVKWLIGIGVNTDQYLPAINPTRRNERDWASQMVP